MDAAILLGRVLLWVEELQRYTLQPSLTHWLVDPWLAWLRMRIGHPAPTPFELSLVSLPHKKVSFQCSAPSVASELNFTFLPTAL
jgi:hypothetical protein